METLNISGNPLFYKVMSEIQASIDHNKKQPFLQNARKEFEHNPINSIGVLTSLVALVVTPVIALLFNNNSASVPSSPSSGVVLLAGELNIRNLLLSITFFLAATSAGALLTRLISHYTAFGSFVFSILTAVLAGFLSLLFVELFPIRAMDDLTNTSLKDAVKYGVTFIYLVINGEAALKWFASPGKNSSDDASPDGVVVFSGVALILFVWFGLLSSGINKLVTAFLATPIVQP